MHTMYDYNWTYLQIKCKYKFTQIEIIEWTYLQIKCKYKFAQIEIIYILHNVFGTLTQVATLYILWLNNQ